MTTTENEPTSDRPTNGRTDGRADRPTYSRTSTHTKLSSLPTRTTRTRCTPLSLHPSLPRYLPPYLLVPIRGVVACIATCSTRVLKWVRQCSTGVRTRVKVLPTCGPRNSERTKNPSWFVSEETKSKTLNKQIPWRRQEIMAKERVNRESASTMHFHQIVDRRL